MNPSFQNGLTTFWLPDKKTMSMLESVYIGDRYALRSFERKSLARGPRQVCFSNEFEPLAV